MMKKLLFLLLLFFTTTQTLLFAKKHTIYHDIPYKPINASNFNPNRNILDVYAPKGVNELTEVVVFIHGGKWRLGNKDLFNYVGVNFAEKGKAAVLINYRLTPETDYEGMAMDCAKAIEWVYKQIEDYGGDKNKIFICGHSSGGHLAALIATNNRFFDSLNIKNPIKGCILIDAFAMDIHSYLKNPNPDDTWMFDTFSKEEAKWKDASPALFVDNESPRYILFLGEKTKNAIYHDVKNFDTLLEKKGVKSRLFIMRNKKHMKMIGQMLDYRNDIYKKCLDFMESG